MPAQRPKARKRQTKLKLVPKEPEKVQIERPSSPSSDDDALPIRPAKQTRLEKATQKSMYAGIPEENRPHGMFGSSDVEAISSGISSDGDSEEPVEVVSSKKKKRTDKKGKSAKTDARSRKGKKQQKTAQLSDDSDDDILKSQPASIRKRTAHRSPTPDEDSENESDDPVVTGHTNNSRPQKRKRQIEDTSDEDIAPVKSRRRGKAPRRQSPETASENDEKNEDESEESETRGSRVFLSYGFPDSVILHEAWWVFRLHASQWGSVTSLMPCDISSIMISGRARIARVKSWVQAAEWNLELASPFTSSSSLRNARV
jgi:hypothetical protein